MREFFAAYPMAAWSLVSTMIALVAVVALWDKVKWWWHNTWYSLPFIGKIARLSRSEAIEAPANPGWYKAERTLCADYDKFIKKIDEHDFNEKMTYLAKAGDNGRRDTPFMIWILTVGLVFVEAMGFSYVLAGYTIPGASENVQVIASYGIAFLVSAVLVILTHKAGHECFKSSQIKAARKDWIEDGRKGGIFTAKVALKDKQNTDDGQPYFTQLANRVGTRPSYFITIVATIFVIGIGAGATYVRGQVLEKQLTEQVTTQINETKLAAKGATDSLDMAVGGARLPDADLASNSDADIKAVKEIAGYDGKAGWTTFIILAFIFIVLQFVGGLFGFQWGFAGRESKAAFRAIGKGRYTTYADVRVHYEEIAGVAQAKLEILQQNMMENNGIHGGRGVHTTKTFYDFIQEARRSAAADRQDEISYTAGTSRQPQQVTPVTTAPIEPAATAEHITVGEILQRLEGLSEKDAKKVYLSTLPPSLYEEVLRALKVKKDEEERIKRARDEELEDLL